MVYMYYVIITDPLLSSLWACYNSDTWVFNNYPAYWKDEKSVFRYKRIQESTAGRVHVATPTCFTCTKVFSTCACMQQNVRNHSELRWNSRINTIWCSSEVECMEKDMPHEDTPEMSQIKLKRSSLARWRWDVSYHYQHCPAILTSKE